MEKLIDPFFSQYIYNSSSREKSLKSKKIYIGWFYP